MLYCVVDCTVCAMFITTSFNLSVRPKHASVQCKSYWIKIERLITAANLLLLFEKKKHASDFVSVNRIGFISSVY